MGLHPLWNGLGLCGFAHAGFFFRFCLGFGLQRSQALGTLSFVLHKAFKRLGVVNEFLLPHFGVQAPRRVLFRHDAVEQRLLHVVRDVFGHKFGVEQRFFFFLPPPGFSVTAQLGNALDHALGAQGKRARPRHGAGRPLAAVAVAVAVGRQASALDARNVRGRP